MKTKNKVLLSATAMLVFSTGAMVTGTVAWFTASRQVSVSFSQVNVISTEGDLEVNLVGTTYTATPGAGTLAIAGLAATGTDISGDGVSFYKPSWNFDYSIALDMEEVTNLTSFPGYYVEFQLEVSRTNAQMENGFFVYLGSNSTIAPVTAADDNDLAAVEMARVAILDQAKTARKVLWAPDGDDSVYTYVDAGGLTSFYGLSGYQSVAYPTPSTPPAVGDFIVGDFVNHNALNLAGTAHVGGNSPLIADLTNDGTDPIDSEIITVRIWIDGDDDNSSNDAKTGAFTVTLDLYAMSI